MDLKGAVAVVTGGNGGLGQRICHALAKGGAHIAVIYAQSRDEAEAVARELASRHKINAAAFACDVTNGAAVQGLIGDVTVRFGRLDVPYDDPRWMGGISIIGTKAAYNAVMQCDLLLMLGTDYPYSEFLHEVLALDRMNQRCLEPVGECAEFVRGPWHPAPHMIKTLSARSIRRAISPTSAALAASSDLGFRVATLVTPPSAFAAMTSCGSVRWATPRPP
jgi:hypothetical protein